MTPCFEKHPVYNKDTAAARIKTKFNNDAHFLPYKKRNMPQQLQSVVVRD